MTQSSFSALHQNGLLILPNAWDALSARVVAEAGAQAIATSSAAVAWAHGYADGERLPTATLLSAVREIVGAVRVPVSVDLEAGYHNSEAEGIAPLIGAILDAGAVGINLEDGTLPPAQLAAKIAVARRVAAHTDKPLFINARTDVYLRNQATGAEAVAETLRRARLYRDAGADGLFVPGLVERAAIGTVAAEAAMPLNLLARPTLPPVAELRTLGVRRLSIGCALAQAAAALARNVTRELLDAGTYGALFAATIPVAELNGFFTTR